MIEFCIHNKPLDRACAECEREYVSPLEKTIKIRRKSKCECYLDCDGMSKHICIHCSQEQLDKEVNFFLTLADGIERNKDTMTYRDFHATIALLYPLLNSGPYRSKGVA